jgi:hypothetical protein
VSNTFGYRTIDDDEHDESDDMTSVLFRVIAGPPDDVSLVPEPAMGISVGLDPTLIPGDDFGGLAGTYLDMFPVAVPIYDSQPPDLPRLEFDPTCDFYIGGIPLAADGPSIYASQSASQGLSAVASMTIQSHDDNTRITVEYALSAAATPPGETFSWGAMAGTQGADPFGIPSHGVFLVLDVLGNGTDHVELHIEWNLTGGLDGDPDEATWDAYADYRYMIECGGVLSPPIPLFEVIEGGGEPVGSRTIDLGNTISGQVIFELDAGVIANATSGAPPEEPPTQSSSAAEGVIEIRLTTIEP